MQQYRVFFLDDRQDRIVGLSAALFESDQAARDWARTLQCAQGLELWSPDQQIDTFDAVSGPCSPDLFDANFAVRAGAAAERFKGTEADNASAA